MFFMLCGCFIFLQLYEPEVAPITTKFPEGYVLEESPTNISKEIQETVFDYEVHNPTYSEAQESIRQDTTDLKEYVSEQYVCRHFARDFICNAGKQGIRAGFVRLDFVEGVPHAIVCFNTTDRGLIFVSPQTDEEVIAFPDQVYRKQAKRNFWQILTREDEGIPIRLGADEEKHELIVRNISILWNDCDLVSNEAVRTMRFFKYRQVSTSELAKGFNVCSSPTEKPTITHDLFGERVIFSVPLNKANFYYQYLVLTEQDENGFPITISISGQDWYKIEKREIVILGRVKGATYVFNENNEIQSLALSIDCKQIR